MLTIHHAVDLSQLNTLRLTSQAENYLVFNDLHQLKEISQLINDYPKFFILGGGSNIILPQIYSGLVIHNQLQGITLSDYDAEHRLATAQAGENWDNFVASTLANQAYGLENLSLIPGSVGAAPVQNIGAYGVEVKDFIHQVEVYDIQKKSCYSMSNAECQFSYRNSIFKNNPRYIVLSVSFKLLKQARLNTNYGDIAKQIQVLSEPSADDLRRCIIATRQSKLPDPKILANAGSFFHNPLISSATAQELAARFPGLPQFASAAPTHESPRRVCAQNIKISAGWLIENLGLKGFRKGSLAVYAKQALVLVNYGAATQEQVLEFAGIIQEQVNKKYHINLNIEPLQL